MRCFGCCEPERPGGTCLLITGNGAAFIGGSSVGAEVENYFLALKRWRGIATRYAKTSDAFIAAVHVRCITIWVAIRTYLVQTLSNVILRFRCYYLNDCVFHITD